MKFPLELFCFHTCLLMVSFSGLWNADLSINQMFQETVSDSKRGIIGGVQSSLNQMMELLRNVAVIFIPDVSAFGYLIFLSFGALIASLGLMTAGFIKQRKSAKPKKGTKLEKLEESLQAVARGSLITEQAPLFVGVATERLSHV